MVEVDVVEAQVRFRLASEGGRETPPPSLDGASYRPHLVVGDSSDEARWPHGSVGRSRVSVAFISGPSSIIPGETVNARFVFMYPEQETVAVVVPGVTFTLREGPQIVAAGRVVSRNVEGLA